MLGLIGVPVVVGVNYVGENTPEFLVSCSAQMKGVQFRYKNEQDSEEISKIFTEDTRGNRCDFLNLVASNMMNYSSEAAHAFLVGLDNEQFTVEVV